MDVTIRDRRALRSVGVQFFINGALYASFLPRLPELRTQVDIDLAAVGLILTLAAVGGLVGSSLTGRMIERFGSKRTMIGGAAGVVVMLPVVGFAASPVVLFVALAWIQFCDVWTDAAMNFQGSQISARRRVPVMNRLHGLWSLGTVIGGLAAAWLAAGGVSIGGHLLAVAVLLGLAQFYVAPGLLKDEPPDYGRDGSPTKRRTAAYGLIVLGVAALVVEMVPTEWAAFRLSEDFGTGPGTAGLGFVAVTTGMVIGRFGGDFAQHRLGRHRLSRLATLTTGLGIVMASFVESIAAALVGFSVVGLGAAVLLPVLYDDAAKAPGRPGSGLGSLTAGIRIGAIVGPVVVGAAASRWNVGSAMAVVALPAVLLLLAMRPAAGPPATGRP